MRASHVAMFLLVSGAAAQPLARQSFEVASIRKNGTCAGVQRRTSPGRLDLSCFSVRELLMLSYGSLQGDPFRAAVIRVLGGPGWIDDEHYDVSAKAAGPALRQEMVGPMLIGLLKDRLHLKAHTEPRDTPVYELKLTGGPSKLRSTREGSCKPVDMEDLPKSGDHTRYCGLGGFHVESGTVIADWYGVTMAELASRALSIYAGEYVVDHTGLDGRFDIHLEFRRAEGLRVNGVEVSSGESDSAAPTIFTALQRLGLKLVPARAPIDVVVVDQVQRPSENWSSKAAGPIPDETRSRVRRLHPLWRYSTIVIYEKAIGVRWLCYHSVSRTLRGPNFARAGQTHRQGIRSRFH